MEKINILTDAIIEKILKGYVDNLKETVSEKLAQECQRYKNTCEKTHVIYSWDDSRFPLYF